MLEPGSFHRKLGIIISPVGEIYTPTFKPGYGFAETLREIISGKHTWFFQKVRVVSRSYLFFFTRQYWEALSKTAEPTGLENWTILRGRAYVPPVPITPEQMRKEFWDGRKD